jgi:hypothetical protein
MILPVHEFECRIRFSPVVLQTTQRTALVDLVSDHVVDALRSEPACELQELNIDINRKEFIEFSRGREDTYLSVGFDNPQYHFSLLVGPTTIVLSKQRNTLSSLVNTASLLERLCSTLFPESADESVQAFSLYPTMGRRVYDVRFTWKNYLTLGSRLSSEEEANNLDILPNLLKWDHPPGSPDAPLERLIGSGSVLRGDVTVGATRTIAGRPRQVWCTFEAPHNVTRKEVDVTTSYRVGQSDCPLEPGDLRDFRTPFLYFYRDIVLNGLFMSFFKDIAIEGRL